MAWIYLAESAESHLPWHHGREQSPIVKVTDTLNQSCFLEWPTAYWIMRRFGMTYDRSNEAICHRSIWFSVGSPVRTSARLAVAKAWKESEAVCFSKSSDWLMNYDRVSFSWKTSQLSLREDLEPCSGNLPNSGMTVDGRLFQPLNLAPRTNDDDGSYLPTPTATSAGTSGKQWNEKTQKWDINPRLTLNSMATKGMWPTPIARDWKGSGGANRNSIDLPKAVGGSLNPQWVEWLMGFHIEWTELDALAIAWFRCKRAKPSKDLAE